jgi:hypothetical protein
MTQFATSVVHIETTIASGVTMSDYRRAIGPASAFTVVERVFRASSR